VLRLECNSHEIRAVLDNQQLFLAFCYPLPNEFLCLPPGALVRSGKEEEIQTKSNRNLTEQPGVTSTEEEGLKNLIAFFWLVTTCSLKDNISEESTAYIFRVEERVQNLKTSYVLSKKKCNKIFYVKEAVKF
jgi:hypothetical protein